MVAWTYITDESKTHLFLSPFFKYILGLKVQFNERLWNFHPFRFYRNLKKNKQKSSKNRQKGNVATPEDQCRDIVWRMSCYFTPMSRRRRDIDGNR